MLFSKEKNAKMEEIREFIPVSSTSKFEHMAPHIANAERDYLIPVIGQPMYEELVEFYEAAPSENLTEVQEKMAELLRLSRSAVLHLAYWIGYDILNVDIVDGGFRRTESTNVKGLFKYQEENMKVYFRTNGFNGLDTVLKYLENNIADFTEFKVSAAFTLLKSAFIPNTDIFNDIVFINKSRLTFLRMKTHMTLIEETEVMPVFGVTAFSALKDEMVKDNPDAKKMAVIPIVRKIVAFLASAMLMEESGADLTDNGLYFSSTVAGYIQDTSKTPSSADRIASLVSRNRNIGNAFLDQLRSYLVAHRTDWQDVPLSTGKLFRRDNTNKKTFWC
jgi:hypothetical protein